MDNQNLLHRISSEKSLASGYVIWLPWCRYINVEKNSAVFAPTYSANPTTTVN